MLPSMLQEHDADEDITIITLAPSPAVLTAMNAVAAKAKAPGAPGDAAKPLAGEATSKSHGPARIEQPPDDDDDTGEAPTAIPIVYDEDASIDEPTRISPLILVSAAAQTDQGRRRRRNEDSMLVLDEHHLYVVADGMGGHAGGDVASKMAVEIIGEAFKKNAFSDDPSYPDVPRRGAELALAIQMANKAIFDHARANAAYTGMGTTVVSARFSPNKQRVYFGHVGDSRCYRLRAKQLTQITTDHTMASQGVTGPLAGHLNRAVGVQPGVKVDLIIARPSSDDIYLLCSDGLSKMVPDEDIQGILNAQPDLDKAVQTLVDRANARGGRDNITVVLVQVKDPKGLAKYIQEKSQPPSA
jgi:protein phosphatase